MQAGLLADYPPWRKLLIGTGIALLSFFILTLAGTTVAMWMYGLNPMETTSGQFDLEDPQVVASLKVIQVFGGEIGLFILPALLLAYLFDRSPWQFLALRKIEKPVSLLILVVILLVSVPVINFLVDWNSRLSLPGALHPIEEWMKQAEGDAERMTEAFLKTDGYAGLVANLCIIALLPAIGEELLFRGVLQRTLVDLTRNRHIGILLTAAIFSAIHLQFFGFFPRMLLGLYFGYLLAWSGTIWLPVVAHFINNAGAVMAVYLVEQDKVPVNPDELGLGEGGGRLVLLSAVLTAGLLWSLYRAEKGLMRQKSAGFPDQGGSGS